MVQSKVGQELPLQAQVLETIRSIGVARTPQALLEALNTSPAIKEAGRATIVHSQAGESDPHPQSKVVAAVNYKSDALDNTDFIYTAEDFPLPGESKSPQPFVSDNIETDDRFSDHIRQLLAGAGIQALATFALATAETHLGWLVIEYQRPRQHSPSEITSLEILARQMAVTLQNLYLAQELDRRAQELDEAQILITAFHALSTPLELEDVYKTISQVFLSTGADKCLLGIYVGFDQNRLPTHVQIVDVGGSAVNQDDSKIVGRTINLRANFLNKSAWDDDLEDSGNGVDPENTPSLLPFLASGWITGHITTTADVLDNPHLNKSERALLAHLGLRAQANIPLISKRNPLGFVLVGYLEPYSFSDRELALLKSLASQTAIAIDHSRQIVSTQQRAKQIQTGAEISKTTSSILNHETLIKRAVNLIRDGFDFYYVGLFLTDDAGEWAVLQAGTGAAGKAQITEGHKLSLDEHSMIGRCIIDKKAYINLDVGEGAVRFNNPHLPLTRSEMALPLISRDFVLGAISIQSVAAAAFSREDIVTLQIMADQIANALLNSRLFQRTRRTAEEFEVLLDINRDLSASVELDKLLGLIISRATDVVQGEQGTIFLLEGNVLVPKAIIGGLEEIMDLRVPLGQGVTGETALTRQSVVRHIEIPEQSQQIPGTPAVQETLAAVPIQTEAELIGVLLIRRIGLEKKFTEGDLKLLEGIALQAAIAVKNARLLERTQYAQQHTESLYLMSRQIAAANTVAEVANIAVQYVPKLSLDRIVFALKDDPDDVENTWVEVIAVWDKDGHEARLLHNRFSATELPILKSPVVEEELIIEDFGNHPHIDSQTGHVFNSLGVKSAAVLPVRIGPRILGWVLAETTHQHHTFTRSDITPLLTVVDQLAVTVDRIQKADSLLKASQRFATMVDNIPGAVYRAVFVQRDILQYISDDIVDITGYAVDEFLDNSRALLREIIHPDDQHRVYTIHRNQLNRQLPYQSKYRIITKRGPIKYISERGRGTFDEAGNLLHVDGVLFDITGRETLQRAFQRRAAQFEAIAEVGQGASAILDVDLLISKTVEDISQTFGFYYAGLFLLGMNNEWAILKAGSGEAGKKMVAEKHRLKRDENSMVGFATYRGEARIALDVGIEPHRFDHPYLPLTRSEIALPLISRGKVIGALDVQSEEQNAFSSDDITTLQLMADQLANVIENARLLEQTERQLQEQAALSEVARVASSTLNIRQIFRTATEQILALFWIDQCKILTYNNAYHNLKVVASLPDQQDLNRVIPIGSDWFNPEQLQRNKPLLTEEIIPVQMLGPDICRAVFVPIYVQDDFRGYIGLGSFDPTRDFKQEDLSIAEALANQIGIALEKAELFFAIQEREQSLSSIHEMTILTSSSLDLKKILAEASQQLTKIFNTDHCAFFIHNDDGTGTVLAEHPDIGTLNLVFPQDEALFQKQLLKTQKPIIIDDVAADPRLDDFRDRFLDWNFKSMLVVPLLVGGRLIGSFALEVMSEIRRFTERETNLGQSIANTIAVAVENARLFEATQQNLRESNLLYRTNQALIKARTEDELFTLFIEKTTELEADSVSVSTFSGQGEEGYLEVRGIWSRYSSTFRRGDRHKLKGFFLESFITRPEMFIIQDTTSDERLPEATRQQLFALDVYSIIIMPIIIEKPAGTVHITYKKQPRTFTENQIRLLESFVQQLAIIWQNLRLLTSIQRQFRREQIIREVTSKIHATTGVDQILQTTVSELAKVLEVPGGIARLRTGSADQESGST